MHSCGVDRARGFILMLLGIIEIDHAVEEECNEQCKDDECHPVDEGLQSAL